MVKRYLFVLLALIPVSARAAEPVPAAPPVTVAVPAPQKPFTSSNRYDFDWNGLPLGRISLETKEDAASYHAHAIIKSKGLVTTFAKHKSDTVLDGKRVEDHYYPTLYETNYQTRNKPKHIRVESDGAGHIMKELCEPADGPDRPKVKDSSKALAADPLTTLFLIRSNLIAALADKTTEFDLNMYDGRRLSKLHFTVQGREKRVIGGEKRATLHLLAKRTPAEGFTPKELDRMKDDPSMHVYFSDDDQVIPLLMEVSWYGTLRGVIVP